MVALFLAVLGVGSLTPHRKFRFSSSITPEGSSIKFNVKASVAIEGTFDKWDASLTFTSPDVSTRRFWTSRFRPTRVNTGSGMKDGKLKSKDFFDAEARSADHVSLNEDRTDRSRHR